MCLPQRGFILQAMIYHLMLCLLALIFNMPSAYRMAPDGKDLQRAIIGKPFRVLERRARQSLC